MQEELIRLLAARKGHFRLESGQHGDLWLDLASVVLRPATLRRFAVELARRLSTHNLDAVCGPLIGGAFLAQLVALELAVEFYYTERRARPQSGGLYPVEYRTPNALRDRARGNNVAIVDDVINAGSAARATAADLLACGARPAAIGALIVLGTSASRLAADHTIPLEYLSYLPSGLWAPPECPLCAARVPLDAEAELPPAGHETHHSPAGGV